MYWSLMPTVITMINNYKHTMKKMNGKAVIQRVLERGNEAEIEEIIRFYKIQRSEINNYKPTNK